MSVPGGTAPLKSGVVRSVRSQSRGGVAWGTAILSSSVAAVNVAATSALAAQTGARNAPTRARTAGEAIPRASRSLRASHERQRQVSAMTPHDESGRVHDYA